MTESTQSPFTRPITLSSRHFPVVVVGAGINGVGVFRDLCLQGVECLLVDKGDVGSGASSAPSRMIHGGLRYLENAEFSLVREAASERNNLLAIAPHLVKPLHTVIPLRSWFGGMFGSAMRFFGGHPPAQSRGVVAVALGLCLYDFMGRSQRTLPKHALRRLSSEDRALLAPDVRWTAHFFDAWISHPERLMHELIAQAHHDQPQSLVSNYCQLTACAGNTLTLCDVDTGAEAQVTADVVVNATGAWLEQLSDVLQVTKGRVTGTKGSHLVLAHEALHDALNGRMVYFEAADGRVCIVYPFLGRVLVGSTDIPIADPEEAVTEADEVDYLLTVLREVFPRLPFVREHIVYTYVGVRPLAQAAPSARPVGAEQPGKISRDHSVVLDPPAGARAVPVISLVGGKWTTFRALAEEATDSVLGLLKQPRLKATAGLRCAIAPLGFDGTDLQSLQQLCERTGVVHLSDLVLHRSLLAFLGNLDENSLALMARAAAQALHWSEEQQQNEIARCMALLTGKHHARLNTSPIAWKRAA
ncbi:glycerol-3-phosphate dehydrogenase/oxidase [Variovorax sp. HJSM1_2]